MLAFSWTKTTLSTEDGTKELLFALMVNPAIEKTRSDGVLVAGIAKTIRASLASFGYVSVVIDVTHNITLYVHVTVTQPSNMPLLGTTPYSKLHFVSV